MKFKLFVGVVLIVSLLFIGCDLNVSDSRVVDDNEESSLIVVQEDDAIEINEEIQEVVIIEVVGDPVIVEEVIIEEPEMIDVYICGGQSNANLNWYRAIKNELSESVVIWQNHPGEPIENWVEVGEKRDNYISDMDNILSNLPDNYDIKGFFWFQGESDSYDEKWLKYEDRFNYMLQSMKEDLNDFDFDTYMFIPYSPIKNIWMIRDVQEEIINSNDDIYGFDTTPYERVDWWHMKRETTEQLVSDMFLQVFNYPEVEGGE